MRRLLMPFTLAVLAAPPVAAMSIIAVPIIGLSDAAFAAGSNATVGDVSGSEAMSDDPRGAIRSMDRASENKRSNHATTKVPALGPSQSNGPGFSRTGGVPPGTH